MIASLLMLLASWGTPPPQSQAPVVEPAVMEALAVNDETYVVIALNHEELGLIGTLEDRIRVARSRLLQSVSESEFRPVYQWTHVAGLTGFATRDGVARLAASPLVESVGVDLLGSAQLGTSVPFIGATTAHAGGATGNGVIVAVIDSGIDTDHPDLIDDVSAGGRHFLQQGVDVGTQIEDQFGHGTAVSATITSGGVVGSVGVAPDARILPIRVLADNGQSFLSDWVAAVDYVISASNSMPGLSVINMSLASNTSFAECPCDATNSVNLMLGEAIKNARSAGILTFASTGNGGECGAMGSPACLESAIAVAAVYETNVGRAPIVETFDLFFGSSFAACFDATTTSDQVTCFSNSSPCNELAAPGFSIATAAVGGSLAQWTGTSQASPHAAGALAVMLASYPGDPERALTALELSGVQTTSNCGVSPKPQRIDIAQALLLLPPFDEFCNGDGGDQAGCTNCPCGNNAPQGTRGGCLNSSGLSTRLFARGAPRVAFDTLRFEAENLPSSASTLLISADNRLPANPSHPCFAQESGITTLGDGLRCVGGALMRHGLRAASPSGTIGIENAGWGGFDAPAAGLVAQGGFLAGQTRQFQAVHRDLNHNGCLSGLGTSQGIGVTFRP